MSEASGGDPVDQIGAAHIGAVDQLAWCGEQRIDETVRDSGPLTLRERPEFDDFDPPDERVGHVRSREQPR